MRELSIKKKLTIIKLYLSGLSYDRIATKALVSKGAVSNVVSELKAGELHPSLTVADDIDTLRELSVSLGKHSLVPSQALVGISVINMLREMNIEPSQIQHCADLYNNLIEKKPDMESLLKVAVQLYELYDYTGLTFSELEAKYNELTSEVAKLTPLTKQVQKQEELISKQRKNLKELKHEITKQASKHAKLNQWIVKKEEREETLLNKILTLEGKAARIEERLTIETTNLNQLLVLGISPEDLTTMTNKLETIAARHNVKSISLRNMLLSELDKMNTKFSLDEKIRIKQSELVEVYKNIKLEKVEVQRLLSKNKQLEAEQIDHKAILDEQRKYHNERIASANREFAQVIKQFNSKMDEEITNCTGKVKALNNISFNAGEEMGKLEKTIEATAFINSFRSIMLGDYQGNASDLKTAGIAFLLGLQLCFNRNNIIIKTDLFGCIGLVIRSLQSWHPENTK